jgi:hypothetical protein
LNLAAAWSGEQPGLGFHPERGRAGIGRRGRPPPPRAPCWRRRRTGGCTPPPSFPEELRGAIRDESDHVEGTLIGGGKMQRQVSHVDALLEGVRAQIRQGLDHLQGVPVLDGVMQGSVPVTALPHERPRVVLHNASDHSRRRPPREGAHHRPRGERLCFRRRRRRVGGFRCPSSA